MLYRLHFPRSLRGCSKSAVIAFPRLWVRCGCDCAVAEVSFRDTAIRVECRCEVCLCLELPGLENLSEPQDDEGCAVPQCSAAGI